MSRAAYPDERACYTHLDGENDDPAHRVNDERGLIGILETEGLQRLWTAYLK